MAQEKVFHSDESGIRVTRSRFIVGSVTYPIAGITSVGAFKMPANRNPAIWTAVIGLLVTVAGFAITPALGIVGILVLAAGLLWFFALKDKYVVRIHTAGGERDALQTTDSAYVEKVVSALNDAVAERG